MNIVYTEFDRSQLKVQSVTNRQSLLSLSTIQKKTHTKITFPELKTVAMRIKSAMQSQSSVVLMLGAHVIRAGMQHYIIDMMQKGFISCIALNGAGVIHDFEFALLGKTTERVADYIKIGGFGLWQETGQINDIVQSAYKNKLGLGEAIGKAIQIGSFPFRDISIFAAAYRLNVPITVHVGIGYDIVHELPNCSGRAYGETSYRDFLRYTHILQSLEKGVVMNFGSAIMAPEIFLKALSMVRNIAHQKGNQIKKFTTLVCDLITLPANYHIEPDKTEPSYYFRPWKTMLIRTIADGGESFYVKGDHSHTIPQLWTALNDGGT